jgi:hypothetical protein
MPVTTCPATYSMPRWLLFNASVAAKGAVPLSTVQTFHLCRCATQLHTATPLGQGHKPACRRSSTRKQRLHRQRTPCSRVSPPSWLRQHTSQDNAQPVCGMAGPWQPNVQLACLVHCDDCNTFSLAAQLRQMVPAALQPRRHTKAAFSTNTNFTAAASAIQK